MRKKHIDLTILSDAQIEQQGLAAVMGLILKSYRNKQVLSLLAVVASVDKLAILYTMSGREHFNAVHKYFLKVYGWGENNFST